MFWILVLCTSCSPSNDRLCRKWNLGMKNMCHLGLYLRTLRKHLHSDYHSCISICDSEFPFPLINKKIPN